MTTYCFVCDHCGATETAASRLDRWCNECPDAVGIMRRDWKAEGTFLHTANLKAEREGK